MYVLNTSTRTYVTIKTFHSMYSNRKLKKAKVRVNKVKRLPFSQKKKVKRLPLQVELLVKKKLFWIFWHKRRVICHLALTVQSSRLVRPRTDSARTTHARRYSVIRRVVCYPTLCPKTQ